ncbi:ABC transporter substrate-binding protein [Limnohabitans sp. TS-CS-82]|uniref:Bug family tripartite tricarboxylate transporter substrate binding protein n=1 Tax=Limnohabitans sp. TS-CS-82 TaxID=2094193 RepID=UPI000CF20A23|nr:tripartite tricarboxylate transporter substrate binding protein [Limnohabitans sp. TS-CS-82]PQA84250.1 ABC transporter substrate-binding protein [Limnohabitans sp. TS-CS-82]
MKTFLTRRACMTAVALGALTAAIPAMAQSPFPSQPIKMIVPYPAGGATDALGRMMAQKLGEAWNTSVVVENKPGAGGTIGNNAVAKAPADGYTILMTITAIIQQPLLMTLPYDPLKDFAPVVQVAKSPSMFAVPLNSPANTLKDFITLVKANPGKYNYGTYGAGTSSHIQGALLNLQGKLDMVHVPFQGAAPLVNNMVGGQLTSAFIDSASARAHLKSFKPLAVTGTQRIAALPDVPTFKELGFHSYEPLGWFGMLLPVNTPAAIVTKYSEEFNRILRMPDVVARIEGFGLGVGGGKPEEFAQVMKSDAQVYATIIKDAGIKLSQ